jgi:hypothetical protein
MNVFPIGQGLCFIIWSMLRACNTMEYVTCYTMGRITCLYYETYHMHFFLQPSFISYTTKHVICLYNSVKIVSEFFEIYSKV